MPAWLLPALMAGGSILSRAGAGAQQERQQQNNGQFDRDRLALQAQQGQQSAALQAQGLNENALMNRAQLGISAPSARMKQALLGSLLQNAQTARYTPPPGIRMGQMSGGLDLSALINAAARQAGGTLQGQATRALETGSDVPTFTDATSRLTATPTPSAVRGPGMGESLLSGGGLLASLLGAVMQARRGGNEMNPISRAGLGL